jgi:NAD(P)-dependent dehydrogenase (short-subunit alcohol dehydrogenase family)
MRGLENKIVIVAGAARGNIGGAMAIRLAEEGAIVVAADLSETGRSPLRRRFEPPEAVPSAGPSTLPMNGPTQSSSTPQ